MRLEFSQGDAGSPVVSKLLSTLLSATARGLDLSTFAPEQDLSSTSLSGRSMYASDGDYSGLQTLTSTPLTVQRMSLATVSRSEWERSQKLGSDHTTDLAWVIPSVVGAVFVLVVLALLFYYGVRTVEMKLARCCYRNCGCCAPSEASQLGSELESLTSRKLYQN